MRFEVALLLKSTLILACAFLASAMMRRWSASSRHAIWTVTFLGLLALPVLSFYFPESLKMEVALLPEPEVSQDAVAAAPQVAVPASAIPTKLPRPVTETLPPAPAPAGHSVRLWIGSIWFLGFAIVLLRTGRAMLATRSLAAQSATVVDGEWPSLITHLRHELDVKEPVDLRFGGDLSPMTWGWRRPKILLPSTAHSWSPERRRVVLTHELAHVKRRDGVTQVLVQLACSLHWFNPLIWFAERRMRTERERACDDYVLNAGATAASYADHLVEIATDSQPGTLLATVSMAQPSQLETRLHAILNPALKRTRMSRANAAILLSCVFVLMIGLAGFQVTTLLSLPLPLPPAPGVPTVQALSAAMPLQQPAARPATPVLPAIQSNEQELRAYLEELAAKRGIAGATAQQPAAPIRTVALVIVFDRSGSMAGSKLSLAREGAKAALSRLRENDLFGVLTFDYAFQWAVPIAEARNKETMQAAIDSILATGNTNIYPALREAYQRLQATTADSKHIILLSDGQTPAENFQVLVSEMLGNSITISTVSLTPASDQKLLSDIAMWGQGRAYYVTTAEALPDIFQREVSLVIGKTP